MSVCNAPYSLFSEFELADVEKKVVAFIKEALIYPVGITVKTAIRCLGHN